MRKLVLFLACCFFGIALIQGKSAFAAGKSSDEIYIQPIPNLEPGFFGISSKKIIEALVPDNYQVYCANPTAQVNAQVTGDYERYLDLGGAEVTLNTDLQAQLNEIGIDGVTDISNPLTIDDSGEHLNIDQTTFIGNHEVSPAALAKNPYLDDVLTADYYKRLSLSQQCNLQKRALYQMEKLCGELDGPSSKCPLNIKIPNTSMKALDFYGKIKKLQCSELEKPEKIQSLSLEIKNGFANTPLPQLNGKRLAFLVRCIEQRPSFGERLFDNSILEGILSFLGLSLPIKDGDECHILTYVTDSPTSKQKPENDYIQFQDLSRQILTPYADWSAEKTKDNAEMNIRRDKALAANSRGYSDSERINCVNCDEGKDKDIKDALVSYINSVNPNCDNIRYEKSETISSQASIGDVGQNYKASGANAFETFAGGGILSSLISTFDAAIKMGAGKPASEIESRTAKVETFIITPHDYQASIKQFLSSQTDLEYFNEKDASTWPTHVNFNQGSGDQSVDKSQSKPDSHPFYDPDKCEYDEYGIEIPGSCENRFGVGISLFSNNPGTVYAPAYRKDLQGIANLFPEKDKGHKFIIKTLFTEPDTEAFLKGVQLGEEKESKSKGEKGEIGEILAQCNAGGPRMTTGEKAEHVRADTKTKGKLAIGECSLLVNEQKIAGWKDGGDSPSMTCGDELYSYVACVYPKTLIANKVNSQGIFDPGGSMTACEYVVSQASGAGVSPRFALAMWGEESGFSNYNGADFGVVSAPTHDLGAQVGKFINLVQINSDYLTFMKRYSGESSTDNAFCNNGHFPGRLKSYYDYL
jgi:hypothetical protein